MNRRVKTYNSYVKESWTSAEQAGAKEFSIIKVMTKTGEKISMCYTTEVKEYGVSLQDNLDFITSVSLVPTFAKELNLTEFDSKLDEIIGVIPNYMISKRPKPTSYVDNNSGFESNVDISIEIVDEDFKARKNAENLRRKEEILAKINKLESILDTKMKDGIEVPQEELQEITLQVESLKNRYKKIVK